MDEKDRENLDIQEKKRIDEILNRIEDIGTPITQPQKQQSIYSLYQDNTTGIVLPDFITFKRFYAELREYGLQVIGWDGERRVVNIKAGFTTISVGIDGIIELLANKFTLPVVIESTQKATGQPPFIEDMENRICNKIQMIRTEFNHLMSFGDSRIEKLCHDITKPWPTR